MKKRKIWRGLFAFLGIMLVLTLVSRGIYGEKLPRVTAEQPMSMALEHRVEAQGTVKPKRELAVNAPAGLRVQEVFVVPGDRVEAGQALFSLDADFIRSQAADKELELRKLELQIVTLEHNLQLAALEKNREMQRAGEDALDAARKAQKELDRAREDEKEARRELGEHGAEYPSEEYEQKIWEEEQKQLAKLAQAAGRSTEDAQEKKEDTQTASARSLEDALSLEQTDAALGLYRMQAEQLQEELEALNSYTKEQRIITAEAPGIVTQVKVMPGEITTQGAALLFADTALPLQFEVLLDQEQKKYAELGVAGEVVLGNAGVSGKETIPVTVEYLTEPETMPGSFQAVMTLPEGKGALGQGGTFFIEQRTEVYPCCVPLDALHQDENKRYFVYVLREEETLLGTELAAEKRMVEVLDQNERYAAIQPGTVDAATPLILKADRDLEDGAVVRLTK